MAVDFAAQRTTATRTIAAPAQQLFDVLANPALHSVIDGSGSVVAAKDGAKRLELGSTFGMKMKLGLPYSITNTVVEFEEGRRIAWQHFGKHIWRWEFEPRPDNETLVTETFDWSTSRSSKYITMLRWPEKHLPNMVRSLERLDAYVTHRNSAL